MKAGLIPRFGSCFRVRIDADAWPPHGSVRVQVTPKRMEMKAGEGYTPAGDRGVRSTTGRGSVDDYSVGTQRARGRGASEPAGACGELQLGMERLDPSLACQRFREGKGVPRASPSNGRMGLHMPAASAASIVWVWSD